MARRKSRKKVSRRPQKLFMGLSATDLLSLGVLAFPAAKVATSSGSIDQKLNSLALAYTGYEPLTGHINAKAALGTYGSAAVPKIGKKILSALGVRNSKI